MIQVISLDTNSYKIPKNYTGIFSVKETSAYYLPWSNNTFYYINGSIWDKNNFYREMYRRGEINDNELFMELL